MVLAVNGPVNGGLSGCHYLPDDDTGPQVEVLVDDAQQLSLGLLRRAVCEEGDGEGVGHADGIGHLQDKAQQGLTTTTNLS